MKKKENNKKVKITFNWKERVLNPDEGRVGAMWCFKRCDVNYN